MTTAAATVTSPPARSSSHPLDVGKLQIDSAKSAYVSSPHWSAVLSGLSELKSFWSTPAADDDNDDDDDFFPGDQSENQYYKEELDSHDSSPWQADAATAAAAATPGKRRFQLLFGGHKQQSLDEILQALPPREVVDRLVLLYFNNMMLPRTIPIFNVVYISTQLLTWALYSSRCDSFWEFHRTGMQKANNTMVLTRDPCEDGPDKQIV